MRKPTAIPFAIAAAAALLGCNGKIMDGRPGQGPAAGAAAGPGPVAGTAGTTGGGTGAAGAGNSGGVLPPPPAGLAFAPEPSSLRRLTVAQYRASITDVFGAGTPVTFTTELEPDTELSGFSSIGAATVGLSAHATEQFETASLEIAQKALADPARRMALGGCAPTGVTDDACTKKLIQAVGRRAWRRPLTDEEASRFAAVAKNAQTVLNDYAGGLAYGVAGLLQSPFFLYRVELGTADAKDPSRVVFDDFELATRLSYFLWNTTPDDALLDAAGSRQLATGLAAQAQRLLASPRASAGMQTFFAELYTLKKLDTMPQLATVFPLMSPTLGTSMRTETLRFLDDIAFGRDADFREIFDARTTFVNGELAKLYGLTGITGTAFVPATLPANGMRAGLLGQAAFLSVSSTPTRASATRRGKFLREMVLCQGIPAAPPGIDPLPENGGGTAKQRLTTHRSVASCAACHVKMDPIGLGLENFDGIGGYRTTDAGQTIDASGDLDGMAFATPVELSALLKNHPNSTTCVARNVFRYAMGHLEGNGEEGAIQQITKGFADGGYRFKSLLAGVVASPSFVYAGKPTP
jgi:hypothetical protein